MLSHYSQYHNHCDTILDFKPLRFKTGVSSSGVQNPVWSSIRPDIRNFLDLDWISFPLQHQFQILVWFACMNWLFIAVSFLLLLFSLFFFLLLWSLCFFYGDDSPRRFFSIICSGPAPWRISSPSWNASGQLVKLVHNSARGSSCGWFLQKLKIWLLGTKLRTATEQQLSAWMRKRYRNLGRGSF